ncbi:DUF305 domain-containing protein [Nesterenkonia halotolerans]|uniref:Uncharacterized protein (DUF305 family) n=1 Tax=Nesterenkonia halotolerans TaxID=225325 RepID=A0ABR9JAB8_9MICC|nr:DUF305 domain-containing protein [Nesterenkonia halotolerans]MBE1515802.1 uncharacterized protein (DUF305 family) [Nesterenkonia halotolerans]
MNTKSLSASIGAFAVAAALASCGSSEEPASESAAETTQSAEAVSEEYNEADVGYVSGMAMHHQQAVEMSEILLEKDGIDPEVSTLAEDIRAAQGPEMEQMDAWLEAWGETEHADHEDMEGMDSMEGMSGMDGMMSEDELSQLQDSTGTEASRLFLEQMIAHHEGAVSSAQDHLDTGQNPEALELSDTIIADQQAEIEEMETLLEDL